MMREIRGDFAMEALSKLERTILGWFKDLPHLPSNVRKWLGDNVWWFAIVGVVLMAITVLVLLSSLFASLSAFGSPVISYYASPTFLGWIIVTTSVSLAFVALECLLLALAVTPLKEKQKKGWVLLFASWLVGIIYTVVSAILTLNVLTVIGTIIFNAIWIAIGAYFLFEIHGQFAHTERSKGVKGKKA